jgi:hypothetical protein
VGCEGVDPGLEVGGGEPGGGGAEGERVDVAVLSQGLC